MITYLANIVNFVALTIQNVLVFVSFVGQIIVLVSTTIVSIILNLVQNVFIFFQVVYEDNINIFAEDLPDWTFSAINAISYQWGKFHEFIFNLGYEIIIECTIVIDSMQWTIDKIFTILSEFLWIFKKTIILLGDTFWFVLMFVPVHLPYLINMGIQSVKDTVVTNVVNSYMALLKVTNFLSDVPFESFMGLIIAITIGRLLISFREDIQDVAINLYWLCVRKVLFVYHHILLYFSNSEVRVIPGITGDMIPRREVETSEDAGADSLCVICQERQKCILTLPCRHVCLCSECCMRLYGYQRTCPICRTFIYHSVTIYI